MHYCETTKAFTTMEYRDVTALSGLPTGATYPTRDGNGTSPSYVLAWILLLLAVTYCSTAICHAVSCTSQECLDTLLQANGRSQFT